MKRKLTVLTALLTTSLFMACGDQGGNKPANAPANAAANNSAAKPADLAASKDEIKKLMDAAQAALGKNDADAMEKIYADDYMLVNLDGSVQSKAERLAALRSGDAKYDSFAYSEPSIRITPGGDDAVVIARLTMKGTFKGKATDGDFRVTQVYTRTKDGWKQISAQATKIEGGTTAPAKAEDKKKDPNTKPDADRAPAPVNK